MTQHAALSAAQPVQINRFYNPATLRPFDCQLAPDAGRIVVELVPLEEYQKNAPPWPADPLVEFQCEV